MRLPLLSDLPKIYRRWQDDDGPLMAAAVAYYAALSFFPLLLVLTSALGFVLEYTAWGQDAEQEILAAIAEYASVEVRDSVADMLNQVQRKAALGGPLGIFGLLFTSVALFAHFERAFDRIWNVENPRDRGIVASLTNVLFRRLRAFLMLLGIGLLIMFIFAFGMTVSYFKTSTEDLLPHADWIWWIVEIGSSLTLNSCVFMLLYKFLPKVTVRWSEALRGGILAGVVWEFGRLALAAYVVGDKYSAYGVVGSFIAVMLWIYFASTTVFLGAEYVQVICEDCEPGQADQG